MRGKVLRASPVALGITVVVAVVSIVAFALTKRSTDQQARALLQNDTSRAAAFASTVLGGVGSSLSGVATVVNLTNASPASFVAAARPLAGGPLSIVLARQFADHYVVTAAVGPAFTPGQVLGGTVANALLDAGATFSPTPVVRSGNTSTAGFAVGPPLVPSGTAVYLQFSLDPFTATPVTTGRLFNSLRVALYGARHPSPSNLLVATTRTLPLPGPVAHAPVPVGTGTWTLVAEARTPLAGSFATEAPFIILLLGLVVALAVGATMEVLVRRQRYAAQLVQARTADLEHSLRDLQTAQAAVVRSERLSALGEMATVVGHELRNPLTAVTNALFLLRRGIGDPVPETLEGHLAMAERETDKATTLAEDLTAFVRPRTPELAELELGDVVSEVLETTPPPKGVDVQLDVVPQMVMADRMQMTEVLSNLVSNAYQAVPEGGSVRIETGSNAEGALLVVEDTGPGVDQDVAARLFEPFFTTKAHGTGLGLAIVRRLVEAHGGSITVENKAECGARVVVHLPAGDAPGDEQ
jgi:signal transduction histidine kinase